MSDDFLRDWHEVAAARPDDPPLVAEVRAILRGAELPVPRVAPLRLCDPLCEQFDGGRESRNSGFEPTDPLLVAGLRKGREIECGDLPGRGVLGPDPQPNIIKKAHAATLSLPRALVKPSEGLGEPDEHHKVGVKSDAFQASDAPRRTRSTSGRAPRAFS